MEWLKKLGAAIDYIEDNLDKEISYDEAARIACCSPYYFQRVFSYVSGVSLAEYIRRRKMTQAAFELQRTDSRVIDVALKYGYSSPTSFNRAFQYESAKEGYGRVSDEISERQKKRKVYMRFIGGMQRLDGFCKEFDEELWTSLLDHATVYTKDDICFTFKVGDEVKVTG